MWRINSVEEITTTTTEEFSDEDEYSDLPAISSTINPSKIPFPEAGIDFIDVINDGSDINDDIKHESVVKWTNFQNWEENWLFKKGKNCDNESDIMLGYMAMVLAELPVYMLIPNPIDKTRVSVGDREVDELSDLSEHNSYGSLEFSDDESEYESDVQINQINGEEVKHDSSPEISSAERLPTIVKTSNDANNELMGTEMIAIKAVGNKNKPNVKLITEVPNYLPKELRNNQNSAECDPYFILTPGDACVQSGIVVQFCCRAKGTKPLSFAWFKNENIIKSDENFRIFQSGEDNVLEIKKTGPDFSAQYSCVVFNSFGYNWSDFVLKVENFKYFTNQMALNQQKSKSENFQKPKGVSTNPKHEKVKNVRPIVVQRTWADRVAELENEKFAAQTEKFEINDETYNNEIEEEMEDQPLGMLTIPIPGTIAEREHQKWEHPDIEWKDNPYSIENLNNRIKNNNNSMDIIDEFSPQVVEEEEEVIEQSIENSFLSSHSKDLDRYKKDYYVKQSPQTATKDENVGPFDESEYSNSKYSNISQTKRKLSEESSEIFENSSDKTSNETESEMVSDSDILLPSVKELVNKFASSEDQVDLTPKLVDIKRKNSLSDIKLNHISRNSFQTTQSNFKVHSLTARSLTKEFREMSHLNIPRTQRNRIGISGHNQPIVLIESESSSPTTCSPTNEGYASDESDSSSLMSGPIVPPPVMSKKSSNGERKFSRSILRRASYWEKRCEKGLISDSSVGEDFPPMEKFAN